MRILEDMAVANHTGDVAAFLVEGEVYAAVVHRLAQEPGGEKYLRDAMPRFQGVPVLPYRQRGVWAVKDGFEHPTLHRLD